MAETTSASSGSKPGVAKSKKLSTRVDLTPMVDLGFLLITFFIFTTTMALPKATDLKMPDDTPTPKPNKLEDKYALTACLMDDNKVFYYRGALEDAIKSHSFSITNYDVKAGFGEVIRNIQNDLKKQRYNRDDLMLLIKPSSKSTYQNTVDALDEVMINEMKRYAIIDFPKDEEELITSLMKQNN
ncbi:MAG: biopolymer transporter ExbD [Chitinophagaceae bacterium]|nr:biopolymer transporter ExbD [Chitinophagaceae bacterium]